MHGISASPILVDGKVVVVIDQLQSAFTVALDEKSGKEVWRSDRLLGVTGGYSSPVLHRVDGADLILSAAPANLLAITLGLANEKALSTMGDWPMPRSVSSHGWESVVLFGTAG